MTITALKLTIAATTISGLTACANVGVPSEPMPPADFQQEANVQNMSMARQLDPAQNF